ncbi:glycine cleavage system H protein [Bathymodiolus platifrons methanotrophic gill symbiont]|uniref:glycine cleavage system protein GcvH n=1 Tax=Bathymodiolus platifrons methanotrophic gill symbiont TaxID=113268 RepID=UPI000B40AF36|nr:glycine cleavage system protein GcvH [Bathymodiolus platifrons methanotrophic gill symbiont]MCK5870240.1 glycine cleavage system protein GcvH [Methyloprofundus sp.]TXK94824.1 glycine cleavage system protein H [Methylococcaceae bacterium CS4]TXL01356.1 glycine cleavage system protein H [Methylococcaceae bacterium CS5]TXL01950.1 glycine cleavage system protein H [Methylococcaceae bacterium HT1]TXL02496.1 glycine cleavage system protein H [Methylococcaceae bacterium CS3]TXL03688.1 glycine cle
MSQNPEELKYAVTHEWVKLEADNVIKVGITDFAQEELGDLVYIELPEVGRQLAIEEQCAVVESVKTASDLFSPVAGEVIAINESLADAPEQVNEDAFNTWLFSLRINNADELDRLLDAEAYEEAIS